MLRTKLFLFLIVCTTPSTFFLQCARAAGFENTLKVVIIRHGEKAKKGHNLSCKGQNRALQLPSLFLKKSLKPDLVYVPSLGLGPFTTHARMFQTASPSAIKFGLSINSQFDGSDAVGITKHLLTRNGTILLVWEHSHINSITRGLGVNAPPKWHGKDFDSIWVVTFARGEASLVIDQQDMTPSSVCNF